MCFLLLFHNRNVTALGTQSCDSILSMLDEMQVEWTDEQLAVLTKALLFTQRLD